MATTATKTTTTTIPTTRTLPPNAHQQQQQQQQVLVYPDILERYRQQITSSNRQTHIQVNKGECVLDNGNDNDHASVSLAFFELANAPVVAYRLPTRTLTRPNVALWLWNDHQKESALLDCLSPSNDSRSHSHSHSGDTLYWQQDLLTAGGHHTGGIIWETAYVLLEVLLARYRRDPVRNALGQVVDVGAGCGFLGQALAAHAAVAATANSVSINSITKSTTRDDTGTRVASDSTIHTTTTTTTRTRTTTVPFQDGPSLASETSFKKAKQQDTQSAKSSSSSLSPRSSRSSPSSPPPLCTRVVMTEAHPVLPLLRGNLQNNQSLLSLLDACPCHVCALDWMHPIRDIAYSSILLDHGPWDTIVGTDILFAPDLVRPLLATLQALCIHWTRWQCACSPDRSTSTWTDSPNGCTSCGERDPHLPHRLNNTKTANNSNCGVDGDDDDGATTVANAMNVNIFLCVQIRCTKAYDMLWQYASEYNLSIHDITYQEIRTTTANASNDSCSDDNHNHNTRLLDKSDITKHNDDISGNDLVDQNDNHSIAYACPPSRRRRRHRHHNAVSPGVTRRDNAEAGEDREVVLPVWWAHDLECHVLHLIPTRHAN